MADILEVRVPDIGDFDTVSVIEVLVAPGDAIEAEQSLITLESDKASMEIPSPQAGTVREIKVAVGDEIGQDAVILTLEPSAEGAAKESAPPKAKAETPQTPPAEAPPAEAPPAEVPPAKTDDAPESPPASGGRPPYGWRDEPVDEQGFRRAYAGPAVRRYARELGVDLGRVQGSGRKGRIRREDVQAFVKSSLQGGGAPSSGGVSGFAWPAMPEIDFAKFGEIEKKPLSRIRKLSAQNLHRSWLHVPHVTQHDEADITEMEAFRKAQGKAAEKRGVKLTPVAFLLKAAAGALKEFPDFNSSLAPSGEELILKKYIHIGVAVDTPNGLVVPVVRDVDQKGLLELAEEIGETSERARGGKLSPKDFQGASFTISSLGGIGGTFFTPIVNAPEVAILGVSRHQMKPVWNGTDFAPRLMLPLSLSYDHRVIDGAAAARFVVHLAGLLSDLRRLLL